MPFSEMLVEFYDELKTRTQGYASLDYSHEGYRESKLVKLDILVNGQQVDALSMLIHADKAYYQGRALVQKLRELIPRQMFEVPIQATSAARSSLGRRSERCGRTCWPSATVATSPASGSCWRSRPRARSE